MVVRAGATRYAIVDRLLEELPRERMLGVVLNRADEGLESNAYYYQKQNYRHQRVLPPEEKLRLVNDPLDSESQTEVALAS
jgi:hypothetical protein